MFGPLNWLAGYVLGSAVLSFIAVRIFDALVTAATDKTTSAARSAVFIIPGAFMTAHSGMRRFTKSVNGLRERNKQLRDRVESLSEDG